MCRNTDTNMDNSCDNSFGTELKGAILLLKHASLEFRTEPFLSQWLNFTGEVLERCMHCFKDFPVSELIHHTQNCNGDMSGPRERFQGFTPSVHDVSIREKRIYLNRSWIETKLKI